ncbi:hypothetical protein FTW19_13640 [Terriglobus albidus]|uniref:Uncharacterized protein n=1 Tax=Terriglobus albidus TaxID=1592106 RepID=A0A5B9EDW2_9BACT|nr:hypothetical protein [Terriglobus albidus]QEE28950.1 hypothetical protein FTW19_13640 [Terriglobus albidus]
MEHKVQLTETERDSIRLAASRILAHSGFRSSERSSRLFRYLVDKAIDGEADSLKERYIGHEVFGREVGYDTASDPVVRNAASETRKRLRQYDAEQGSAEEVRIALPAGTYVLDFSFSPQAVQQDTSPSEEQFDAGIPRKEGTVPELPVSESRFPIWKKLPFAYSIAAIALIGNLLLAAIVYRQKQQSGATQVSLIAPDPLWRPMFATGKEVFIALGHAEGRGEATDSTVTLTSSGLQRITVTDLKAYTNISGFLQLHGHSFQMRTDAETTLLDLRDRPIILIGNHNNSWARRLTQNLRYRFDFDEEDIGKPNRVSSIVDSQRPGLRLWQVPIPTGPSTQVDYGIAGRFLDPVTGGIVIYLAGAGPVATQAASEFLTQQRFLRDLPESINDPKVSFEVVLKTPIVAGVPGSPEVIATDIR